MIPGLRWLAVTAVLGTPVFAAADSGDLQLELAGGYRSRESVDLLAGGTLGLGDFTFARGRLGFRAGEGEPSVRLETTAGYLFDVLTWVPEVSAGVAIDADEVDVALTGLLFVGLRYYLSLDSFVSLEFGGELDPDGAGALVRLSYAL